MRSRIRAAAIHTDDVRFARHARLQRRLRKAVAQNGAGRQQADFLVRCRHRRFLLRFPMHCSTSCGKLDALRTKWQHSRVYTELQVTTNYSFLRGASHVEELFARAAVLGMKALG